MRIRLLILVLIQCVFFHSWGQVKSTDDINFIVEDLIEAYMEESEDDEEYDLSEISERLNYYLAHPADLNVINEQQLRSFFFLSPLQIQEFLVHRDESGGFISLYELQAIKGFDERTLARLMPFIKIGSAEMAVQKKPEHDLILRYGRVLEKQKGYMPPERPGQSHYVGSPEQYFVRYRMRGGNYQFSLNMKKDPGEGFFDFNQRNGFDFYSSSFALNDIGRFKRIVVGDYSLQLGQGLAVWSGLSFGKGALVQNVARQGFGLRPYTSTNESQFLRGFATTISLGRFEVLPFVSYKKVDAPLSADSLSFSSIASSGYHRTPAELRNRNSVSELVYGLNLAYRHKSVHVGAAFLTTSFDKEYVANDQLYNTFSFAGRQLSTGSMHYHYTFRNIYVFGEMAHSLNHGFGVSNGLIGSLSDRLSLVLLHRDYQKNFYSFLNQGFSESSRSINEKGLYTGLIWDINRRFRWVLYADYFKFPGVKYRVDAPSEGNDLFTQFTYSSRKTEYNIRFRSRTKQENSSLAPINQLADASKDQLRFDIKYFVNPRIQLRNRLEVVRYLKGDDLKENGYLVYQDVVYKPVAGKISGNLRVAAFKTDGYNSRLYAFENNVLYGNSSAPYHGKGLRSYVNVRYRVNRQLNAWLRYATFLYADDGIGSSLNYIEGNRKSDIRVQLRYQF